MLKVRRVSWIGPLAMLLVACGGSSTSGGTSSNYSGKTINLGAVVSLSGGGGVYGPQQKNGIELAVETINKNGINGAKISVDVRDDRSDKQQSAHVAQTFIQTGKVFGIIGPTLSNSAVDRKSTRLKS